jgi:hypothetical protein
MNHGENSWTQIESPIIAGIAPDPINAGPRTTQNYHYQSQVAALYLVQQMALGHDDTLIWLEHSCDLVVEVPGELPLFVSIKHQEHDRTHKSGWNLGDLGKRGVLNQLANVATNATSAGYEVRVRFETNTGRVDDAAILGGKGKLLSNEQSLLMKELCRPRGHKGIPLMEEEAAKNFIRSYDRTQDPLPSKTNIDAMIRDAVHDVMLGLYQFNPVDLKSACGQLISFLDNLSRRQDPAARRISVAEAYEILIKRLTTKNDSDRPREQRVQRQPGEVDRIFLISRIHEQVDHNSEGNRPVLLHGITGCGKTTLAQIYFAKHYQNRAHLAIDASSPERFTEEIRTLARRLGFHDGDPLKQLIEIGDPGLCLLLDGVGDSNWLAPHLPRRSRSVVIITSRSEPDFSISKLNVSKMSHEDVSQLVQSHGINAQPKELAALLSRYDSHILAIRHVLSNCRRTSSSIDSYLRNHPGPYEYNPLIESVSNLRGTDEYLTLQLLWCFGPAGVPRSLLRPINFSFLTYTDARKWSRHRMGRLWQQFQHIDSSHLKHAEIYDDNEFFVKLLQNTFRFDHAIRNLMSMSLLGLRGGHLVVHNMVGSVLDQDGMSKKEPLLTAATLLFDFESEGRTLPHKALPHMAEILNKLLDNKVAGPFTIDLALESVEWLEGISLWATAGELATRTLQLMDQYILPGPLDDDLLRLRIVHFRHQHGDEKALQMLSTELSRKSYSSPRLYLEQIELLQIAGMHERAKEVLENLPAFGGIADLEIALQGLKLRAATEEPAVALSEMAEIYDELIAHNSENHVILAGVCTCARQIATTHGLFADWEIWGVRSIHHTKQIADSSIALFQATMSMIGLWQSRISPDRAEPYIVDARKILDSSEIPKNSGLDLDYMQAQARQMHLRKKHEKAIKVFDEIIPRMRQIPSYAAYLDDVLFAQAEACIAQFSIDQKPGHLRKAHILLDESKNICQRRSGTDLWGVTKIQKLDDLVCRALKSM